MVGIVILAAGFGKRLKSPLPKVLNKLAGYTLLDHILAKLPNLPTYIIINPDDRSSFPDYPSPIQYLYQHHPNGTGDALLQNLDHLPHKTLLILNGDTPLISKSLIMKLINSSKRNILVGFHTEEKNAYGQMIQENDHITQIIEACETHRPVSNLYYSGLMKTSTSRLEHLRTQAHSNITGESYLTRLVHPQRPYQLLQWDERELMGINTPKELYRAHQVLHILQFESLSTQGVTFDDPSHVLISPYSQIGHHCHLGANISIHGRSIIHDYCHIGQGSIITNSTINAHSHILPYTMISQSCIGESSHIGPHAHIQASIIKENVCIGNYVEIKRSQLQPHVKAKHLSYLGDSYIDEYANIGAGTITCNFTPWHKTKTKTYIGCHAFIGASAVLLGSAIIGDHAIIAAGSIVSSFVQPYALAISRAPFSIKASWAKQKNLTHSGA